MTVRASSVSGLGSASGDTSLDVSDKDRGILQRRLKTRIRFAALEKTNVGGLQKPGVFLSGGVQGGVQQEVQGRVQQEVHDTGQQEVQSSTVSDVNDLTMKTTSETGHLTS